MPIEPDYKLLTLHAKAKCLWRLRGNKPVPAARTQDRRSTRMRLGPAIPIDSTVLQSLPSLSPALSFASHRWLHHLLCYACQVHGGEERGCYFELGACMEADHLVNTIAIPHERVIWRPTRNESLASALLLDAANLLAVEARTLARDHKERIVDSERDGNAP